MSLTEASGALLLRFYDCGWPKGYYHEFWNEELIGSCNECFQDLIDPEKVYPLSACGELCPFNGNKLPPGVHSFEEAFNLWMHKTGGARTTLLSTKLRWEQGVAHDSRSVRIVKSLQKIDVAEGNFDWKVGGDGDNGETLMYQLDVHFYKADHQLLT